MRKTTLFIILLIVVLMAGIGLTVFAEEANLATAISRDDLHLTIYNDGLTLVQDVRTFELAAGLNQIDFSSVSPRVDMTSVAFISITDPINTYVVQQQFVTPDPALNTGVLLQENIGNTITVVRAEDEISGILLSTGSEIILELDSGQIQAIHASTIREYRFDARPDVTQRLTEPSLQLLVNSVTGGEQQFVMTYLVQGLSWQSTNYNLVVLDDTEALNITGWVTLNNGTGIDYDNANVTLATGNFNRLQYVSRDTGTAFALTATPSPSATPTGTPAPFNNSGVGQNQQVNTQPAGALFPIDRRMNIPADGVRLIEFLAGANAETREVYVYDASPRIFGYSGFITDPAYGLTNITTVLNFLEFTTFVDGGLGTALPAGQMRVYQDNDAGTPLLIGESNLGYTPENETVQIFLENNTDLTGERRQTDYQALSGDVIQETFEIRLRNRLNKDVTVIVPERLSRSANWEIIGATAPFEQPNSFGIEFEVDVASGEEVTLSYTVLYTRTR